MPVVELLGRVSSRELTEWQAYFRVEAEDEQARRAERPDAAASDVHQHLLNQWGQRKQ